MINILRLEVWGILGYLVRGEVVDINGYTSV